MNSDFQNFLFIIYGIDNHTIVAPMTCLKYVKVKKNQRPKNNIKAKG